MRNGSLIPLAYNSHMGDGNSGREWSVRPADVPVSDVNSTLFPGDSYVFVISIETRGMQLKRIYDGIRNGSLIGAEGQLIPLNNDEGISLLSDTAEANIFSVNTEYYGGAIIPGGVHNEGHIVIALAQDPRNENGGPPGVMADPGTSMRDPMFFPYHNSIDDIFTRHKNTLPPYQRRRGNWSLLLRGVRATGLKVQSMGVRPNVLHTFWGTKRFDLSKGLDFNRSSDEGPMWTCMKHLDHQSFEYELEIERRQFATDIENVTVRIFIGPREDSRGRRYTLEQQRHRMFILDTFTVPLQFGINTIRRNSTETPLTIDFHQSAQELAEELNNTNPFCGCGWPHHLLLPKGTRRGLHMDLFAIVTDAREDYVEPVGGSESEACKSAYVFCGVMGDRYPDRRPMGYPFDRRLYITERRGGSRRKFLQDLVREVPNSAMTQVKVKHFDKTRNAE